MSSRIPHQGAKRVPRLRRTRTGRVPIGLVFLAATGRATALQTRLAGLGSLAPYDPNRFDPRRLPRGARLARERDPAAGAHRHPAQERRGGSSNDKAAIRVTALTDSILRVRVARGGSFPEDASWAVPAEVRAKGVNVEADGERVSDRCARRSDRPGLRSASTITDLQNRIIQRDPANAVSFDGDRFTLRKAMPPASNITGSATRPGRSTGAARATSTGTPTPGASIAAPTPSTSRSPSTSPAAARAAPTACSSTIRWRSSFDFGHRDENMLAISADGGPDRLLPDRRPNRCRRRPPLHRPDRQGADAAALGARLPAIALQLHERDARCGTWRRACAPTGFRRTSSGSTSTSRIATGRSPIDTKTFPEPARPCPTCAGRASSS